MLKNFTLWLLIAIIAVFVSGWIINGYMADSERDRGTTTEFGLYCYQPADSTTQNCVDIDRLIAEHQQLTDINGSLKREHEYLTGKVFCYEHVFSSNEPSASMVEECLTAYNVDIKL